MRLLIIFIFLITNVLAEDVSGIKNIVIHKVPKTYNNVIFLDKKDQKININEFKGKLLILNFWATWCEPCKEEMPSLENLQTKLGLNKLKIFTINIGNENLKKVNKFYLDLNIKNLEPYFDHPTTLAKTFSEVRLKSEHMGQKNIAQNVALGRINDSDLASEYTNLAKNLLLQKASNHALVHSRVSAENVLNLIS